MWRRLRLWLASLLRGRRFDAELADELAFHLRARTEHWEARGLSSAEARRRARVEFGSVDKANAEVRDVRRGAWIEALGRDVRHGLRTLRRYPAFSAMAVLSLAIGIGANATIFGVTSAMLFRTASFDDPETLVNVYERVPGELDYNLMSSPNVRDLRDGTAGVFTSVAASTFVSAQVDVADFSGTILGESVTGGAFGLLGIDPHLGRAILPEDDVTRAGHPVVMLAHGYWQRRFGGDPAVVGRTLRMSGRDYTIIGIAPPDYAGGIPALTPAFYVPMAMADELLAVEMLDQRDVHNFFVKARLAPGVSRAQAERAASLVAASLSAERPEGWVPGEQFVFVPTADVQVFPGVDPLLQAAAGLLMAVVGLVLLLACTNLASFLLARAVDRWQEVAVRRALGATRGALVRQSLIESTLLGVAGAATGLALAAVLLRAVLSADLGLPFGMRLDLNFGLDWRALLEWRVLALTAGAGVLAGGALGLVPAVQGASADPGSALRAGARGSDAPGPLRWRNLLVVAQVAISVVLLVGAGLFLRSWQQTLAVDPGFGRAPTSILSVMVPVTGVTPDEAALRMQRLLERVRALPGVVAAGLVWPLPLDFSRSTADFTVDGHVPPAGLEAFRADRRVIDGAFFDAAGVAIVAGRTFDDGDRHGARPVAIISEAMARRYWPAGDALGRILRRPDPAEADLTVVGVASDINMRSLGEAPRDVVYEPFAQSERSPLLNILVRSTSDAAVMAPAIVTAAREVDPDLQIIQSTTMARHLALSRLPSQAFAFLLSAFGAMAMALAVVGLYGLVRYTVARRTREVGIRMALGADAASVARLLAGGGVRLAIVGGVIGMGASLAVARVLASLLFDVRPLDPLAYTGALAVFVAGAWLAAWLPARRASRVNPLAALRTD